MSVFAVFASVALSLPACTGSGMVEDVVETLAVRSAQTRIQMDSQMQTVWNSLDAVSVFYGSSVNERWAYSGRNGSPDGVLRHEGPSRKANGRIAALYPYQMTNVKSGSVITSTIPSEQKFIPGSFDGKAAVMTAVSSDGRSLEFSFAVSFVAVELTGTVSGTVSKFVLRSLGDEPVAGDCSVDIDSEDRPAVITEGGSREITMALDSPVGVSATPNMCVFSVAPGLYPDGFEIELEFSGGSRRKVYDSLKRDLEAGHLHVVSAHII